MSCVGVASIKAKNRKILAFFYDFCGKNGMNFEILFKNSHYFFTF
jgi:hypothetical protein